MLAVAITGQDVAAINIAAGAGANAAANNWLQPKEQELRRQAQRACDSDAAVNAKACGIVDALNRLDIERETDNNGTFYKGISKGLIALLLSPATVPVELIASISDEGWSETAKAILKNAALLPTNIILGLKSDDPEVQGRAVVDALATTAGVTALTKAGLGLGSRTGTVWDSIKATQEVWPGTPVPRSFELQAGGGTVWVAGNATEHIFELASGMAKRGASPEQIGLATQAELTSLHTAVESVIANGGISYSKTIIVGGMGAEFSPSKTWSKVACLSSRITKTTLMMKIAISGIDMTARPVVRIEVDDYVPLSFRSYALSLGGVRDVRLGDLSTNFLELKMSLDSRSLRAFTLLSFDAVHESIPVGALREEPGLPILDLDETLFEGPWATQRLDLPMTFSVGFGKDFFEINFGMLSAADRAFVCGPVKFLVNEDSLLGIQVLGLTREQLKKIRNMRSN